MQTAMEISNKISTKMSESHVTTLGLEIAIKLKALKS